MNFPKRKNWSITLLYNVYTAAIAIVLLVSVVALFYVYLNMKELNDKFNNRYISYQLADELRQSSDDLTRMARTFVATGDPRYEKAYLEILAIRNGEKSRPEKYNQIYWDLMIVGDDDDRAQTRSVPLRKLMEDAGFTEAEFDKLREAQNNSDDLVKTETIAMNAIKEINASGGDSLSKSGISRDSAINMMHNLNYHLYKHKIMKPIDDFFDLLNERTLKEVEEYQEKNRVMIYFLVALPTVLFGILGLFYFTIRKRLIMPVVELSDYSNTIAMGEFGKTIDVKHDDEIGSLSKAINEVAKGMEEKAHFVSEIGKTNLNVQLKPLSEKDSMAFALIEMKQNLHKVSQEEKKRTWATEGLAHFGELLRQKGSLQEVFDSVLAELVRYLNTNQGAIFVLHEEEGAESYLQLLSCYAWSKKKYYGKKVFKGEGLAGQVWQEEIPIYLKEVPDNYILITSGLGEALPKAVIIVPLKTNEEILGIIEIASFNEIQEHERNFLNTVAENMASVLSTLRIAERTRKLLEQSQNSTEELRRQEEEMRQNMEELNSTQEEMRRKEQMYIQRIQDLEKNVSNG